jgi:ABC-type glycerol-3-phosphate transport system substrate-binding protein
MKKKQFWLTLLIILLLAVACGGEADEEPEATATPEPTVVEPVAEDTPAAVESEAEEPVVVQMAVLDALQGLYGDLIKDFEDENPDINIKLVSVEEILGLETPGQEWPDDAQRRLVSAADVSDVFYSGQAARDGLLLDMQPFMESDRNFDENDFYPQTLEAFQSDGGTWAIPTDVGYRLMFVNKDAFDEAGLDYPEAGWSWEDFLATAQALTLQEGDQTTQWGLVEISPYAGQFVESRVGQMVDLESDPPVINLDDPEVATALRWYTDLYLVDEVAPYYDPDEQDSSGLGIPQGYLTIEGGQAAMWPDSSSAYPFRLQQMNVNLGVAPFPVDEPDSATSLLQPNGLSISVGTANPEAAWRWVDYLSRQTNDLAEILGGRASLPARVSVAEASGFWDEVDEELGQALQYAVDHSYTTKLTGGIYEPFNEAFEAVMAGDKTVEAALADAQIAAENSLEKSPAEDGDDEEIVVEADEADTSASEDAVNVEFVAITGVLEMQTFRDLADQFLEENPGIVVEVVQPNLFEGTPSMADIAGVSDCFQWFPGDFSNPDTQAAILSLDPFLDADAEVSADDFYQAVFDAFVAQGQTWGLPGQVNITLIEYNKELFDEAGLDYPAVDWTTDDFLNYAVELTQGEGDTQQYGYVPALFEPSDMLNMMDRLGARLIDDEQDPPTLAFTDPATVAAVRWYTGLTTEYGVKPVFMTSLTDMAVSAVQERENVLAQGRAAMWSNSAFEVDLGGDEEAELDTGAVPVPAGPGEVQGSGYQSAIGYFISADTQVRDACWQWIKFLTEQPTMGNGLPARQELAESDAFREQVGPELADAYLASMANATVAPLSQQVADENSWLNYPIVWLYSAYSQIVKDGLSVEEALENAQQLADEYRACVIEANAFDDEDAQQACMLEVDETLPPFLFGG